MSSEKTKKSNHRKNDDQEIIRSRSLLSQQATRQALRDALETMEFAAFERIMKRLLYKSGYDTVQLIGRNYKRGRTPKGGMDMTARSATELASSLTIAQVKQYKRVVSRRFVDELRGAMLRLGAEQGLLLTMSTFSKVAHEAARESHVAPIKLIEGEEVLDLLFACRIGVTNTKSVWSLDSDYLDKLREKVLGNHDVSTHGVSAHGISAHAIKRNAGKRKENHVSLI